MTRALWSQVGPWSASWDTGTGTGSSSLQIYTHSSSRCTTSRQPPPLNSVLYRIISKRRCVCTATQLLIREKSGAQRLDTDTHIPNLPGGLTKFKWWKLKMSYHTAYPSLDVQLLFATVVYSLICPPTTAFT